jgi:hypothetical protein
LSDQELGKFSEGFASWRRLLAAMPDDTRRLTIFLNAATDVAGYVSKGLNRIIAADELADMAIGNGLNDTDQVQAIIAEAFEHIEQVPDDIGIDDPRPATNGHDKTKGPAQKYRLIAFRDLRPGSDQDYLVKGLFPRTGLAAVWGPPKCGKSFWLFDLLLHVALNWKYRGRRIVNGPVVYCAFEGADGFRKRVEAFRLTHGSLIDSDPPFYLMPTRIDLIRAHRDLIQSIRAQTPRPVAVALDTLNRSLVGSESKDEDMAKYLNAADAIREAFNCLVVIVHHSGVDASRPRGHTGLTGAVDAQLSVVRDESNNKNFSVTLEYMKDGLVDANPIASFLEQVDVGIDADGDVMTSCVVRPVDDHDAAAGTTSSGKPRKKLPPIPFAALRALHELVAESPTVAPPSLYIPACTKGVTLTEWRVRLGKLQLVSENEGQRKQFQRIHVTLKNAGRIGIWDQFVWPVT